LLHKDKGKISRKIKKEERKGNKIHGMEARNNEWGAKEGDGEGREREMRRRDEGKKEG
jgi:hypothetical protein